MEFVRVERRCTLKIHLIDGTYELFRHYYALPSAKDQDGFEVAAVRGVLSSVLGMLKNGVTHIGVATDHVIESFRNELWPSYKTGEGIKPALLAQFFFLEEVLLAAGIVVWPMVKFEADDALAAAAGAAARDARVEQVVICTPDKDLAQCVQDTRIVQLNRRKRVLLDEAGVVEKFGVAPKSIPDYLALVGDTADGYPGLPGWGAKSAAAVLAKYSHLEFIPRDWREWHVNAANASSLAYILFSQHDPALLFRKLATLQADVVLFDDVEQLRWKGPTPPSRLLGHDLMPRLLRRSESFDLASFLRRYTNEHCSLEIVSEVSGHTRRHFCGAERHTCRNIRARHRVDYPAYALGRGRVQDPRRVFGSRAP